MECTAEWAKPETGKIERRNECSVKYAHYSKYNNIHTVMVCWGRNPMNKDQIYEPLPPLNPSPRVSASKCIPHCSCKEVLCKAHFKCSNTWLSHVTKIKYYNHLHTMHMIAVPHPPYMTAVPYYIYDCCPTPSIKTAVPSSAYDCCPILSAYDCWTIFSAYDCCPILSAYDCCPILSAYDCCPILAAYDCCPILSAYDCRPILSAYDCCPILCTWLLSHSLCTLLTETFSECLLSHVLHTPQSQWHSTFSKD